MGIRVVAAEVGMRVKKLCPAGPSTNDKAVGNGVIDMKSEADITFTIGSKSICSSSSITALYGRHDKQSVIEYQKPFADFAGYIDAGSVLSSLIAGVIIER